MALAIAKPGSLYIFDEPEAGIDMWSFDRLKDLLKDKTAIVVSHQRQLLNSADTVVVMNNCNIVASGKPSDILKDNMVSCYKLLGGKDGVR